MKKKTNDISSDTLKELVRTHGDGIVTGTVRYRKVKPCNGYKEAEKEASLKFSFIAAGRILPGGGYAAVIRFRLIFFILIFLCMLSALVMMNRDTGATVRKPEISETEVMDVPGYTRLYLDSENRFIPVYNPEGNPCSVKFCIYYDDEIIYESENLKPGEETKANIYDYFRKGVYEIQIVTTGISENGEILNSVSQKTSLKILEE